MELEFYTFPNGLRVVHQQTDGPIAHCGLYIDCGSRDELPNEQGLAHFVEHMLFKGTSRRKTFHILSRLDSVGGEINAFTTKEDTCIYASFLKNFYPRAVDLILDIVLNASFPEKEMLKERDVILEEIESYKDNPSEQIFDDFEDLIFAGHPIGRNILGTPDSVNSFSRKNIVDFIRRNYHPEKMVFSSVGNISLKKLTKLIEQAIGDFNPKKQFLPRKPINGYNPGNIILDLQTHQTHIILGNRAFGVTDEKHIAFSLLNNLLGGPGLNNRLNLNIREKYGFTYHVESYYNAYSDAGIFGVYIGTDRKHIDRSVQLIKKELKSLQTKPLGSLSLHKAKKQWIGQMYLQQDSRLNRMLNLGKALLVHNEIEPWKRAADRLEKLTSHDLLETAEDIFGPSNLSSIIYKEKDSL